MSESDVLRIQIDGMKLEPINRSRWASKRGAMAHARRVRVMRETIRLRVLAALGRDRRQPARVVITRLSAGELDRGAVWEACKVAWDGVADALGLADDRELQRAGDVAQAKCPRGTCGVVIELFFAERRASGT